MGDVLILASEGTKKTRIMYGANLSYEQLGTYLGMLTNMGLLAQVSDGEDTLYRVTESGRKFIECYNALTKLLETQFSESALERYKRGRSTPLSTDYLRNTLAPHG